MTKKEISKTDKSYQDLFNDIAKIINEGKHSDKRAITPLLSEHINPYGEFPLDMNVRLEINFPRIAEVA